jgi:hypothetical protein
MEPLPSIPTSTSLAGPAVAVRFGKGLEALVAPGLIVAEFPFVDWRQAGKVLEQPVNISRAKRPKEAGNVSGRKGCDEEDRDGDRGEVMPMSPVGMRGRHLTTSSTSAEEKSGLGEEVTGEQPRMFVRLCMRGEG